LPAPTEPEPFVMSLWSHDQESYTDLLLEELADDCRGKPITVLPCPF